MKKGIPTALLIEIVVSIFILLFLYTGISKLREQAEFQVVLSKSPLLRSNAFLMSLLLPITEIGVAILLFFPKTRKYGLVLSTILMTVFTFYISYMLMFTSDLPCSCGGVLKQMSWQQHLVFNIFFLLLGIMALYFSNNTKFFIAINRNSRTPV